MVADISARMQGRTNTERGFTLMELMVVVVIIGVLAAAAVYMFSRNVGEAHASEVHHVFAEFRIKQEQYHIENGAYLSVSADESDSCCGATKGDPAEIEPAAPAEYGYLRLNFGKPELKCNYVVIAGRAQDSTGIGPIGATILDDPPPEDWWYGIAECPANGKTYVARYNQTKVIEY